MSSNLARNLKCSLSKFNIREVYAWSDSTVTFKDERKYKVFVCNQVAKIKETGLIYRIADRFLLLLDFNLTSQHEII